MILIFYAMLCAAMFYLGSRAKITEALWSRYPRPIAGFMDCAACVGFWWGVIWHATIGRTFDVDAFVLPAQHPATPALVGLCMLVLTPIAAAIMHYALVVLGHATFPEDGPEDGPDDDLEL